MEKVLRSGSPCQMKEKEDFSPFIHVLLLAVQGKCRFIPEVPKGGCCAGLNVVFLNRGSRFKSNTEKSKKHFVPLVLPHPSICLWYSFSIM